jgi:hypothetical protein
VTITGTPALNVEAMAQFVCVQSVEFPMREGWFLFLLFDDCLGLFHDPVACKYFLGAWLTLTTANLTVSHGPVINIVSEATQHQSSPVDQHQRSQVDQHQRQTGNIQRPPSILVQRVQMHVNESTNNDHKFTIPYFYFSLSGMLDEMGSNMLVIHIRWLWA